MDKAEASKAHFRTESIFLSKLSLGPDSPSEGRRVDEERDVTEESTVGTLFPHDIIRQAIQLVKYISCHFGTWVIPLPPQDLGKGN